MNKLVYFLLLAVMFISCKKEEDSNKLKEQNSESDLSENYQEKHRPQFHFSPDSMWMNDPNGMVYANGIYHLFYQYHPEDTVWGPMHWGHATSEDLIHWEHQPVALFPDELGTIFSGSAVIDKNNTAGFGENAIVAIYTNHSHELEKEGALNYQTQSIAYSTDSGETFERFSDNPVLPNSENIKDFRDPKVMWYQPEEKWVMSLVAGDRAQFYESKDLKSWNLMSEFGQGIGAHGGVWECPDLFEIEVEGSDEKKWVLIISINPGGPHGGSASQYFVGEFDGKQFTTDQKDVKWIDQGADNYAGVLYNNAPNNKKLFMGWMSNWEYAQQVPTERWRSAMTLPRELTLHKTDGDYQIHSKPVTQFQSIVENIQVETAKTPYLNTLEDGNYLNKRIQFHHETKNGNLEIKLSNSLQENYSITFDAESSEIILDRTKSGKTDFVTGFGDDVHTIPVKNLGEKVKFDLILDQSSIELFINDGQYVATELFFPSEPYKQLSITDGGDNTLENFSVETIASIWRD